MIAFELTVGNLKVNQTFSSILTANRARKADIDIS